MLSQISAPVYQVYGQLGFSGIRKLLYPECMKGIRFSLNTLRRDLIDHQLLEIVAERPEGLDNKKVAVIGHLYLPLL